MAGRLPWRVRPGLAWGFIVDGFFSALMTMLGDPRSLEDLDLLVTAKLWRQKRVGPIEIKHGDPLPGYTLEPMESSPVAFRVTLLPPSRVNL